MSVEIIAEIGGNHDGRLDQARRLIEKAAWCGADTAKFQFYRAAELYPGIHTPGAIPEHWLPLLQATASDNGLGFLCSVFSLETLAVYMALEPAAVKIASPEATNHELLAAAVASGVRVLVATGACTTEDVDAAAAVLEPAEFVLLHCVSAYPAPLLELNLAAIPAMRARYFCDVGLSDHSTNPTLAPMLAVAAGATIIEKHLTPDRALPGPDHAFAMEPEMFRAMCRQVRLVEDVMGDGVKQVTASEDPTDRRTMMTA